VSSIYCLFALPGHGPLPISPSSSFHTMNPGLFFQQHRMVNVPTDTASVSVSVNVSDYDDDNDYNYSEDYQSDPTGSSPSHTSC
jgi:hypothetical protein